MRTQLAEERERVVFLFLRDELRRIHLNYVNRFRPSSKSMPTSSNLRSRRFRTAERYRGLGEQETVRKGHRD